MKFLNNITSLFVGENSIKRQIGMGLASMAILASLFGWITEQEFKLIMMLVGPWIGFAFSAKLSKLAKAAKK